MSWKTAVAYYTVYSIVLFGIARSTSADEDSLSILFGGDTSFGENYQERVAYKGGENMLVTHGYDHSLAGLITLLRSVDFAILNLETPLTTLKETPFAGKDHISWSDPKRAPAALKRHGIDAVSLGNNHTLDRGPGGLEHTMAALQGNKIAFFGAGKDESAARLPLEKSFEIDGLPFKIAIIGTMEIRASYDRYDIYAEARQPGVYGLQLDRLCGQIAALRAKETATLIVVFPHWGRNYTWRSADQQQTARSLIDAGADLILGHGAHQFQEIEQYRNRWIVYSLGNFMFNAPGRYQKLDSPPYSLPLVLDVRRDQDALKMSLRMYPICSDNRVTNYQPHPVNDEQFEDVRRLLVEHSNDTDLADQFISGKNRIGRYLQLPFDLSPKIPSCTRSNAQK